MKKKKDKSKIKVEDREAVNVKNLLHNKAEILKLVIAAAVILFILWVKSKVGG